MTTDEPESVVLCLKGHSMGLSRITEAGHPRAGRPISRKGSGLHHEITIDSKSMGGMKQVPAMKGFAFPCPTCMLMYWDDGSGQVSLLSPLQFVAAYMAINSPAAAEVVPVLQMQRELACLYNTAKGLIDEVTRRGLMGGNVT